mgnify:CR=1 FL=1
MLIDPGELDQRINIEEEVATPDGMGGTTTAWNLVAAVWAKVRPLTGKERTAASQVESPATYAVIIRNRAISENQRIKWVSNGNRLLNIRFIGREQRSQYIKIEAEMGVQD